MTTNSNINYCFYKSDGEILMFGSCPPSQLTYQSFEGASVKNLGRDFMPPSTPHYINNGGEVTPCESFTIDSIPLPCVITIESVKYEVTTEPTFEFDAPGTYEIHVDAGAKYIKETFIVNQS